MKRTHIQDPQEPMVHDLQDPDGVLQGTVETWQDIAAQYRADHRDADSVLGATEELLLELGDALAGRAARESAAGHLALARRTLRFERHVNELFRRAETVSQAQMAATALVLSVPRWLFEGEDGAAWRREITALSDYAGWACPGTGATGGAEGSAGPRGAAGSTSPAGSAGAPGVSTPEGTEGAGDLG